MAIEPGYKQTEVGVIPEDWQVVQLDSIATRGSGHTPSRAHSEYWNGQIKWISLADSDRLDRHFIGETAATVTSAGIANSSARLYKAGTVVVTRDAGVGKSAIMSDDMAVSQHFMAWSCGPNLNNHFLYYWLQDRKLEFERIASGNTIKTIGLRYFTQLKIAIPAIKEEQEAIAEALSDADALVESLEELIAKKRHLKQGAMQELLTGKKRLPGFKGEFQASFLGQLASLYQPATISARQFTQTGFPVYGANGVIGLYHEFNHSSWQVIVTCRGSTCGSINRTVDRCWITGNAMVVNCDGSGLVDKAFLYYLLSSTDLSTCITGTGQPQIVRAPLASVLLSMPKTTEEQAAIANLLADMDAEIEALEQKLEKARQIKQGMMQELLTGKTRLV